MNAFEKIINTFSYGGLFLTACALVVLVLVLFRFIKSKKALRFKEEILPEEITAHRKKRTRFIVFLVVFVLLADFTLSSFIVKGFTSDFSYMFYPIHSAIFSNGVLTVSEQTEYETEAPKGYSTKNYSGKVGGEKEETFSFTAKTNGSYLFRVKELSDGLVLKFYLRDSDGNNIDYASGVRSYTVASMDNVQKGVRYTLTVVADEGEGRFTLESIAPKNFDIKHYTAIKDSVDYDYQSNGYYYTAPTDGVYAFYLTDVRYDCNIGIGVPKALQVVYSDKDYVAVALEKGETYCINVNQMKGYCSYTLNVRRQKTAYDISGYTEVNDTMEFIGQHNMYSFSGRTELYVKFELNGINAMVFLMDEEENIVAMDESLRGFAKFTAIRLDPDKTYTFVVACVENNGKYKFTIE